MINRLLTAILAILITVLLMIIAKQTYYSEYDLNKDGLVNALDLAIEQKEVIKNIEEGK